MSPKPGVFGKRVIGEEQFNKEQAMVQRKANKYGPRVVGPVNELGEQFQDEVEVGDEVIEVESVSVEDLENLLDENPYLVDRFLSAEVRRPDGTRKGALEALHEAEVEKGDSNPEVLATIDEELDAWQERHAEDEDEE